jgi:toxin ParE1/3/4
MSRLLVIHEAAEAEINEAADFYDSRSPGLGTAFIDEIERGIRSISEFPEATPLIRGRVRKKIVARFPYSLIYSVRPDVIRILAVAHHKRRPFYWHHRQ